MVREFYVGQVTGLSEQQLQELFQSITPPACLLGGWAVHLHVNDGFQRETGREYIGSRDIDLGIHINPEWSSAELKENTIGDQIRAIKELDYERSRFGFVQYFLRDTGDPITEEEAGGHPLHEVFPVYIDLIPDTTELDAFHEAFGFTPPAEPLLKPAFDDASTPLSDLVSWDSPDSMMIADPGLLAAMKIRSLPDRDKSHKQVKDLADLHTLLWYVTDLTEVKNQAVEHVSEEDLETLQDQIDQSLVEAAAELLQVSPELIQGTMDRLLLTR